MAYYRHLIIFLLLLVPTWSNPFWYGNQNDIEQAAGLSISTDKGKARTDTVGISVGRSDGTTFIKIDTSADRMGINTNTPTQTLDVIGTIKASSFIGEGSQLTGLGIYKKHPIKSNVYQLVIGDEVVADSHTLSFGMTLPPSPDPGDWLVVQDAGNASVNNITIFRNGNNIHSTASDLLIDVDRMTVKFIYINPTYGWLAVVN
jgi:hypothetical protein